MDVKIQTREGFTVLGVQNRIDPMTADYKAIWEGQYVPRDAEIMKLAVDGRHYAVYYPAGEGMLMDMLAGMAVPAGTAAPEGLVARDVAGGLYAVVESGMEALGATWMYLYQEWQQTAGYAIEMTGSPFEEYPAEMAPDVKVGIWVPVVAK